ncbi:glycosyltransferase family 39 protein [Phyllobacterium sp. LjRoot231]|uniref:glycosyltransferase family 39 protein n=1 Tax=Phyllobacterium sp. LjRoot231 TaxID=3342289 RepID=UPI003ECD235D
MASLDGPAINWSNLARLAPRAIVLYILVILVLRLLLSRFMEIDEAQFVGEVAFAWNYGNSHPPMYNWLVRLALELTGWNWVPAVALVRLSLLGLYHWLTFDTARRLGGDRAGVLALATSALLPQIVWMSIQTTAHTILVISAAIGIVHSFALLHEGKGTRAYVWFGIWAAIGALAKYNFFIFLISFLIAAAMTPTIRRQLFQRQIWISIAIFVAAFTPVVVASLNAPPAATAGRMYKLAQAIGYLESFDLPRVGLDGLASLLISTFLWAGPALIFFRIGQIRDHPRPVPDGDADVRKLLLRTILIGLAAFAVLVFVADYHSVAERYMAPILAPTAILLALYLPQVLGARNLLVISGAMYILAPLAVTMIALFGTARFNFPFDSIADAIRAQNPTPARITSNRQDDAGNVAALLRWPPERGEASDIVLVWQGDDQPGEGALARLPTDAQPIGPVTRVTARVRNFNGEMRTFSFQRYSSRLPIPDQNSGG